ncbi:hypothetical protein CEXT_776431 [Caerostris extrusa]|uniref:Uncharacterized protein n=1 Tax=Caerostris extrusa TaxID=172846 RepID=A0AAV4P9Z0_CAEEX|nr:hypothetical protein CEXT_776431 [Caerostris extrusa]
MGIPPYLLYIVLMDWNCKVAGAGEMGLPLSVAVQHKFVVTCLDENLKLGGAWFLCIFLAEGFTNLLHPFQNAKCPCSPKLMQAGFSISPTVHFLKCRLPHLNNLSYRNGFIPISHLVDLVSGESHLMKGFVDLVTICHTGMGLPISHLVDLVSGESHLMKGFDDFMDLVAIQSFLFFIERRGLQFTGRESLL